MKLAVYVRSFARPIGRAVTADDLRSTFSSGKGLTLDAAPVFRLPLAA